MESAVGLEEEVKVDLSEIEEGHESQVSESDDQETELYGEPDSYSETDDKMMRIFSERIELPTDSESSSNSNSAAKGSKTRIPKKTDPIAFFTTTLEPRSPDETETDTNTSQFDDYRLDPRSELVGGTTDADSSLEYQHQFSKQHLSRGDTKMTSSGDSLEEPFSSRDLHTPQNPMEVSRDSLELEKEQNGSSSDHDHKMTTSSDSLQDTQGPAQMSMSQIQMTDSFTNVMQTSSKSNNAMTDSLEMELPSTSRTCVKMSESSDSLTGGCNTSTDKSTTIATVMAVSSTSTDSLEGGPGIAEPALSSGSTSGDAAMWSSSTGGSVSTLISDSQEDLTIEGTQL